jgi:glutamate formiminotransferase
VALLESVPNVSEGRDPAVIEAIAAAFGSGGGRVLDVHSDAEHHRSVVTLVADEADLAGALLAGIARAAELIDLREHDGIHPRVGAADVVPIVPLGSGMEVAHAVALELGRRVGDELGLPVFLYGESAEGVRPAFYRRGGPAELQARVGSGELRPAFGPSTLDPRAGAVLIGARPVLVAFNIELVRGTLADAQAIAAEVRGSSGGMPGVQALGLLLPESGRVQVSLNVIDVEAAPLASVVARVHEAAAACGAEAGPSELVGLMPERSVAEPALLGLDGLPDDRVLERRL